MATEKDTAPKTAEAAQTSAKATVHAAADAVKSNTASAKETTKVAAEKATEVAKTATVTSARAVEEGAERSRKAVDATVQASSVVGDGMQAIMREWTGYAQGALQRQVQGVNDLMKVRSVPDMLKLQADRLRQEMEILMDVSVKVSEAAARVTTQAYGKFDRAA